MVKILSRIFPCGFFQNDFPACQIPIISRDYCPLSAFTGKFPAIQHSTFSQTLHTTELFPVFYAQPGIQTQSFLICCCKLPETGQITSACFIQIPLFSTLAILFSAWQTISIPFVSAFSKYTAFSACLPDRFQYFPSWLSFLYCLANSRVIRMTSFNNQRFAH